MAVFLKAQIISYHGIICLLAHPNPSFHNVSLCFILHRLQHQSHSIYSTFSYTISSIITTALPNLLFLTTIIYFCCCCCSFFSCHITCTQYLSKQNDFPCC